MKKLILLTSIFYSLTIVAYEDSSLKQAAEMATKINKEIQTPLLPTIFCGNEAPETKKISCSEITDNFCKNLWNESNQGNLKVFDGQILAGKSKKSGIALATLEDNKALINSVENMVPDMKEIMSPLLEKLKKHLEIEDDTNKWSRKFGSINKELSDALADLTEKRFEKENPPLLVKNQKSWNTDQTILYSKVKKNTFDDMTIAKYSKHENWKRVENVFPLVKENLAKAIDRLNIPEERKIQMKKKVASVTLSLPFIDPDKLGASDECATNEVNAFYSPSVNKFTFCAGYINTYQTASNIAAVLAHEIGHSIDSSGMADEDQKNQSKVANVLAKLSKKSFQCDDWKKINKEIFVADSEFKLSNLDPLEKLYACLRGDKTTEAMTKENLSAAAKQGVKKQISTYAGFEAFSTLLKEQVKRNNVMVPNDSYFRPDVLLASWTGTYRKDQVTSAGPVEIFMQNFNCALQDQKLTKEQYAVASKDKKAEIFDNAIKETGKILEIERLDNYKYCGKNCSSLAEFDLSVDSSENMADWLSIKAYPDYLKEVPAANRVEASSLFSALMCNSDPVSSELSGVEKKYSLEAHPDNRIRRVSLYTKENADLVGCQSDKNEKGFAQCQP